MRGLARLALKLLTGMSTVFIAACYGVPYPEHVTGRVRDALTLLGIPGIRVGCLDGGDETSYDLTDEAGDFYVPGSCAELRVEDVDAEANGAYASKTVLAEGLREVIVDLDRLP
jgi:hypothetical protein